MKKIVVLFYLIIMGGYFVPSSIAKAEDMQLNEKIVIDESLLTSTFGNFGSTTEKSVLVSIQLGYESFMYDYAGMSEENVRLEKDKLLQRGKEYHSRKNQEFFKKIQPEGLTEVYVSSYAPYVNYNEKWETMVNNNFTTLNSLASENMVKKICVEPQPKYKPSLDAAKDYINVSQTIASGGLTGNEVNVGVLEPGIADKNHSNFRNTSITVRNVWNYNETVTEHATRMSSIIAGVGGIAPQAKIFSVELSGDPIGEIDWLLDKKVDIINMSYSDTFPNGVYGSHSAYADYIVDTYKVTIVAAAGNSFEYVGNPGLGYNVITVGACSSSSNERRDFSSFQVQKGPSKPNFLVPGNYVTVNPFQVDSGTSISAAIVSGCVALLMQSIPSFKLHPERIMALLSTNSQQINETTFGSGFRNESGTGRLDFQSALDRQYYGEHFYNYEEVTSIYAKHYFNLQSGQVIRASLAWLAWANGNANDTKFTDYDIRLCDSAGNNVAKSISSGNAMEFIEYRIPSDGMYYIEISQDGNRVKEDEIAFYYKVV